jgi:hypothetical protein
MLLGGLVYRFSGLLGPARWFSTSFFLWVVIEEEHSFSVVRNASCNMTDEFLLLRGLLYSL